MRLSPRQRDVVDLMAQGLSNHQIAQALFLSEQTIKNHLHNVAQSWHCKTRTEIACKYARKRRWEQWWFSLLIVALLSLALGIWIGVLL